MAIGTRRRRKIYVYNRAAEKEILRRTAYAELLLFSEETGAEATVSDVERYLRGQSRLARLESRTLIDEIHAYLTEQKELAEYDLPFQGDDAFSGTKPLILKRHFGRRMISEERRCSYAAFSRHSVCYQPSACFHMN